MNEERDEYIDEHDVRTAIKTLKEMRDFSLSYREWIVAPVGRSRTEYEIINKLESFMGLFADLKFSNDQKINVHAAPTMQATRGPLVDGSADTGNDKDDEETGTELDTEETEQSTEGGNEPEGGSDEEEDKEEEQDGDDEVQGNK